MSTDAARATLPSAMALLKEAWKLTRERLPTLAWLAIVPFVAANALAYLTLSATMGSDAAGKFLLGEFDLIGPDAYGGMQWVAYLVAAAAPVAATVWSLTAINIELLSPAGRPLGKAFEVPAHSLVSIAFLSFAYGVILIPAFLLFIIPGIYALLAFSFYDLAFLAEGKTGWSAFARSRELVRGYWWAVFGRTLITLAPIFIIWTIIVSIISPIVGERTASIIDMAVGGTAIYGFLTVLSFAYFNALKRAHGQS